MEFRAAAKGRSLFRLAAAALLVALAIAPQIAVADAAGYPETRDRLTSLSDQVCDQVDGSLSRLPHSGYRDPYDENVVGSLLVPGNGLNPRLQARADAWRAYKAGGGEMDMSHWVRATKRQYGDMTATRSGYRTWVRGLDGPTQNHHLISNPIVDALEQVGISRSTALALRNNPALQKMSAPGGHIGWQSWHRSYDAHMAQYILERGPQRFRIRGLFDEITRYYSSGQPARRIPGVNLRNP